jgi:hypothetical protein
METESSDIDVMPKIYDKEKSAIKATKAVASDLRFYKEVQ